MELYDVYLKQRLTEIDVIITQLVQRDAFSMYDWLNIFATMDDIEIRKALKIESEMFIDVSMHDILKIVHEQIVSEMYLGTDVDLLKQIMASGESEIVLSADEMDILEKSFISGDSALEIYASPLDYYVALLLGNAKFDMTMFAEELDTLKYSIDKFENELYISADTEMASKKMIDVDEIAMFLDVAPTDIFYLLHISGEAMTYLYADMVDDLVLKNVLHDPEFETWLDIDMEQDFLLKKFTGMEDVLNVFANIVETIIQFIQPITADMYLDCEASAGLKRYRLLYEMDDLTLSDFDNMTLEEVDYVIIVE